MDMNIVFIFIIHFTICAVFQAGELRLPARGRGERDQGARSAPLPGPAAQGQAPPASATTTPPTTAAAVSTATAIPAATVPTAAAAGAPAAAVQPGRARVRGV